MKNTQSTYQKQKRKKGKRKNALANLRHIYTSNNKDKWSKGKGTPSLPQMKPEIDPPNSFL